MEILQNKSDLELAQSLLAEIAKSTNELRCAAADIGKAHSRLSFLVALSHEMIERTKGPKDETL
jgi:hypothetical protein